MRPFQIRVPQEEIDDMRRRIAATRWPNEIQGVGWARGIPLAYMRQLADYWHTGYDWRAAEAGLNKFPNFITEIDGVNVHFMHIRSSNPAALPILLTHGWPSSVVEFLEVIGPLTEPGAHGGDPADAFHVVVPSLPGHGFSGPTGQAGWDVSRIGRAWGELMRRLGYQDYIVQGADWGSAISLQTALQYPDHVVGVHLNMCSTIPPSAPSALAELGEADQEKIRFFGWFVQDGTGYSKIQSTRPQTLAYGLTDSPVGQLAWVAEKFKEWTGAETPEAAVGRDHLLTNATIYWLTATAGSSAQLYYESTRTPADLYKTWAGPWPLTMPVGVAVFPYDVVRPVRSLAEKMLSTIVHWTEFDRGGHFGALTNPDLLVADIRAFTRTAGIRESRPVGIR